MITLQKYGLAIICSLTIISCSDDDSTTNASALDKSGVITNYANLVYKNYQDAHTDAQSLKIAIDAFVANPTAVNFTTAKEAWLTARESYGTTEAFRFANGPIDIDDNAPEGLLNSWPLDENYIDYVDGAANSGIINDDTTHPTITKTVLEGLNTAEGNDANVSVGYHAIEFLLWGQDLTMPSVLQAGQRPYTDYVDGGTASNQDRRRAYLAACADLLTDHLQLMLDEWKPSGDYRATFLALNEDAALKNMLGAIATLSKSELAGERIFVAYSNQDQEDEHSCFSDNTHRDIRLNLAGIANVYRGSYSTVSGISLEDIITTKSPTLGAEISAALTMAEANVDATATPFDYAITNSGERPHVATAVTSLQTLGDKFVEGGVALGINVTIQ
jgi:putative iron-regulated protein